jgi:glycosyltransferase involved in cell wall biosynthesis
MVMMISIAMATYNGEEYLASQIESIIGQSFSDFELVVCDDCSSDNTFGILQAYAKKDRRISVYRNRGNLGFRRNFEKALGYCEGQYIALSDQDDVWDKDHLRVLRDNISDYSLICSNAEMINQDGTSRDRTMKDILGLSLVHYDPRACFQHLLFSNIAQGASSLFHRSILEEALPIPASVAFHDHWLAAIAASCNGVLYLDQITMKYRQHDRNVTTNTGWNVRDAFSKKEYGHLPLCIALIERIGPKLDEKKRGTLEQAIEYYSDLKRKKIFHLKSMVYLIKNYWNIYWGDYKGLLVFRAAKVFLGRC